ncbi:hypothetical protein [Haloplanus rubicundus]|uniref:hypothetical protein n=1 Tax=Haloplanus rubicundus TaxID=1547898 RepID=UPI001300399C|nr:hypothetical protein [Haloplanus rubicundus]
MTVDPPEFDPELDGHTSAVIGNVCHAIISEYDESGHSYSATECGVRLEDSLFSNDRVQKSGPKHDFTDDADIEMCDDCWPEDVI